MVFSYVREKFFHPDKENSLFLAVHAAEGYFALNFEL